MHTDRTQRRAASGPANVVGLTFATRSAEMKRIAVALGLAALLGVALSIAHPLPASAAAVTPAPPLSYSELQQLHQVTTWTIEVHKMYTLQGTGGGASAPGGGGTCGNSVYPCQISSWTAGTNETDTMDATYTVKGTAGCPGSFGRAGCPVDYGAQSLVSESFQVQTFTDATVTSGCPTGTPGINTNGGSLSATNSRSANGSLTLDGSPGHQVPSYVHGFFIDYSTNPPTTGSDVVTGAYGTGTVSDTVVTCGTTITSYTNPSQVNGSDLSFYFANPTDFDAGGDTQVRIENGYFVVSGSETTIDPEHACPSAFISGCPQTISPFGVTYQETDSWTARSATGLDTTPPVVTVPNSPVVAEATGRDGAVVTFSATATDPDNGAVPVDCTPPSGSTFPLGSTTVTCTATDPAGNVGTASFTVVVQDTTPPDLTLPSDITINATSPAGAQVLYAATAVDLVDGVVPVTCFPPSGTIFLIGSTTVNCSASDSHGNTATGSFNVHIKGAGEQVSDLLHVVEGGNLGTGTSLSDKLQAVLVYIAAGDKADACGTLAAFIHQVQAQSGSQIPAGTADQLIAAAQRIRAVLGC